MTLTVTCQALFKNEISRSKCLQTLKTAENGKTKLLIHENITYHFSFASPLAQLSRGSYGTLGVTYK